MSESLIWLHEDALRQDHPAWKQAPPPASAAHIWDEAYLREAGYSFKRLVFLFETVCELRIPVLRGPAAAVLRDHPAGRIVIPESPNPFVRSVAAQLATKKVDWVTEEPFAALRKPGEFKRFFQYWSKAEKLAFLPNGGADAQRG